MTSNFNNALESYLLNCSNNINNTENCILQAVQKLCSECLKRNQVDKIQFIDCWENESLIPPQILNYSFLRETCIYGDHYDFLMMINNLYIGGYAVSLIALVISLIIFLSFRSLHCLRIRIHIQLFLSFVLNNIIWIIYHVYLHDPVLLAENPIWCKFLTIFCRYTTIANQMWMFCEGLHLHLVMVVVFVNGDLNMKWFLVIGWGVSLIATIIYIITHLLIPEEDERCWMYDEKSRLAINIPIVISLLISLLFLINVLRIILKIMHPTSTNPAPLNIRRTLRAAFILIPLLGLHVILLPFKPSEDSAYYKSYEYLSVLLLSSQGLCVSILFCFANHEVHQAFKTSFSRVKYACRFNDYLYTGQMESADVYTIRGNTQTKQEEVL